MTFRHSLTVRFGASGSFISSAAGIVNITNQTRDERRATSRMICESMGIKNREAGKGRRRARFDRKGGR